MSRLTNTALPKIGMPLRMDPGQTNQYLSRQYMDAIAAIGGIPIALPLLENPRILETLVDQLDGFLLTGSNSDVDPRRYGDHPQPQCGPIQPLRDATDFMLLDVAKARGKPLLAICFGMQSLNVYRGGSLIQDIKSSIRTSIEHDPPDSEGKPSHDIDIEHGSVLQDLARGIHARVNSSHHQALDRVGSGLRVIARSPDGIIEALDGSTTDQFLLAVQWHPEKSHAYDELSRKIFELFLSHCRRESGQ